MLLEMRRRVQRLPRSYWRTGFKALDQALPGGGWPAGTVVEILAEHHGIGELQLVMPMVIDRTCSGHYVAWIAPPYIPYAPALAASGVGLSHVLWIGELSGGGAGMEHLWAAEQVLRQTEGAVVLVWLESCPQESKVLRRLQIAAEKGAGCALLFRSPRALSNASPAAIRIALDASAEGTSVRVVKCRGRVPVGLVMRL